MKKIEVVCECVGKVHRAGDLKKHLTNVELTSFDETVKIMGDINQAIYGVNPYRSPYQNL